VAPGATRLKEDVVEPRSTLVDGHSALKRVPYLLCLVYFQCSLMTLWALP
jgi:hypothetical protein